MVPTRHDNMKFCLSKRPHPPHTLHVLIEPGLIRMKKLNLVITCRVSIGPKNVFFGTYQLL